MISSNEYNNGNSPSNSEFLTELLRAAPRGSTVWVNAFIGNPNGSDANWGGRAYNAALMRADVDGWTRQNTYFSVGAVTRGKDGSLHRRKSHFARLLALVADDVSSDELLGAASWSLETSPGKRQVGIFLDGADPDCANIEIVSRLVTVMAERGHIQADLSGNNAVRYVRLPVGQNQKPRPSGHWTHRMEYWRPQARYALSDAAAIFGIDLDEIRHSKPATVERATIHQGEQDERLKVLTGNILRGEALHDSINIAAASLVASGTAPGAVVNILRALMDASSAVRDDRWKARYEDIPRSVSTAQEKFKYEPTPRLANASVDPLTGEIKQHEPLFEPMDKIIETLSSVKWIVRDYLEMDALSMVFGPSGAGKSFVVTDLAASIATGTRWMNREVRQGAVFYIAGEGHNGLARRFAAWSKHHNVSLAGAPLFKSKRAVSMLDGDSAEMVRLEIERMIANTGYIPMSVILDTLARNFGQGDENKQADANRFIEHLDTFIRRPYGCNVMIVHHSGHDMDRARGSSVFKAAMDQEFWVKGANGMIEFTTTKMKDAELPPPQRFKIKQIDLDRFDDEGVMIRGAYIAQDGNPLEFEVAKTKAGKVVTAYEVMKLTYTNWPGLAPLAQSLGVSEVTIERIRKRMLQEGLLEPSGGSRAGWKYTEKATEFFELQGDVLLSNHDKKQREAYGEDDSDEK